jgi:hypothetical protein
MCSVMRLSETIPGLSDSELLNKSYSQVSLFPSNIIHQTTPQYRLDSYSKRLKDREPFLFYKDSSATLDILKYDNDLKGREYV